MKIDHVNESICGKVIGDDEIEVVKVVLSLLIGEIHSMVRCSLGKGYHINNSNCPCPVPNCTSRYLESTFNCYSLDLRETILTTGKDAKNKRKSSQLEIE